MPFSALALVKVLEFLCELHSLSKSPSRLAVQGFAYFNKLPLRDAASTFAPDDIRD